MVVDRGGGQDHDDHDDRTATKTVRRLPSTVLVREWRVEAKFERKYYCAITEKLKLNTCDIGKLPGLISGVGNWRWTVQ